ncbi:MAG: phosphatase PAP2 family protein [Verrucomicrobiota bacterium]
MKDQLRQAWNITKELHREAWQVFKQRWPWCLLGLVLILIGVALILPHDKAWLAELRQPEHVARSDEFTTVQATARSLSYWGDFFKLNVIILGLGLPLALVFKSCRWQRIVLAITFAALWAGIAVNILRPGFGRPRPSTDAADGLNPMTFSSGYHSFPSGHASTAFATATAVTMVCPPAAFPAYITAGGIAWSRMQLNRHHPADILGGFGLGTFWGFLFGTAYRRTRGDKCKAIQDS